MTTREIERRRPDRQGKAPTIRRQAWIAGKLQQLLCDWPHMRSAAVNPDDTARAGDIATGHIQYGAIACDREVRRRSGGKLRGCVVLKRHWRTGHPNA